MGYDTHFLVKFLDFLSEYDLISWDSLKRAEEKLSKEGLSRKYVAELCSSCGFDPADPESIFSILYIPKEVRVRVLIKIIQEEFNRTNPH
jgi:hypothetical protein